MKKKLCTLAMVVLMVTAFSFTVFATENNSTSIIYSGNGQSLSAALDSEASDKGLNIYTGAVYDRNADTYLSSYDAYKDYLEEHGYTNEDMIRAMYEHAEGYAQRARQTNEAIKQAAANNNLKLEETITLDLSAPATGNTWDGSDIGVNVTGLGLKAGDNVMVLHLSRLTGEWETINAVCDADNHIVLKGVRSFSPFVVAKVTAQPQQTATAPAATAPAPAAVAPSTTEEATNTEAVAETAPKSPKTGFSLKTLLMAIVDLF